MKNNMQTQSVLNPPYSWEQINKIKKESNEILDKRCEEGKVVCNIPLNGDIEFVCSNHFCGKVIKKKYYNIIDRTFSCPHCGEKEFCLYDSDQFGFYNKVVDITE